MRLAQNRELRKKKLDKFKARKLDSSVKAGPERDSARELLAKPKIISRKNDDASLLSWLEADRRFNRSIHQYHNALDHEITAMSVLALSVGWQVIVNCISIGVKTVSSQFLQKRSLTELYVLKKKIHGRGPKVNELLRDMITRWMEDVGIELHNNPAMVKYYKDDMFQHMNIEYVSLDSYSMSALEFVKRSLRSKGYLTKEKLNVAELIYAYRLNRAVSRGRDLTLVNILIR